MRTVVTTLAGLAAALVLVTATAAGATAPAQTICGREIKATIVNDGVAVDAIRLADVEDHVAAVARRAPRQLSLLFASSSRCSRTRRSAATSSTKRSSG